MDVSKAFRMLILASSFLMFIWQASVAVSKLMDPSVVDSTDRLNIDDIEPILITVCPLGQWNDTMLWQYGYGFEQYLLLGFEFNGNAFVGWGAQHNLTFEELVGKVTNYNLSNVKFYGRRNKELLTINYEIRFYPKYGYCYDLANFTTSGKCIIRFHGNFTEAQVYITDKKLRTRNTVFAESHWGSKIILKQGWSKEYIVKVEQLSNLDPRNPDDCKEYEKDDYEKCVDDDLQKVWKPLINCNPPWISSKDQCEGVMNISKETKILVSTNSYHSVYGIYDMETYPAKESCKNPCIVAQPNIFYGTEEENTNYPFLTTITLNFADKVVFTTKKLAYGPSAFLIDMDSSLGL